MNARLAEERGKISEDIVELILKEFVAAKKIRSYERIKKYETRDMVGRDFNMILNNSYYITFQVKSSWIWVEKHRSHGNIPFVVTGNHFPRRMKERTKRKLIKSVRLRVLDIIIWGEAA